jgi:hypothetical protein
VGNINRGHSPDWPGHKCETLLKKYLKQKGLEMCRAPLRHVWNPEFKLQCYKKNFFKSLQIRRFCKRLKFGLLLKIAIWD